MGTFCCCIRDQDVDEYRDSNTHNNGNWTPTSSLFQNLMNKCREFFGREEMIHAAPSIQEFASLSSTVPPSHTPSEINRSYQRYLPEHENAHIFQLPQDVLFARNRKGTGHSLLEAETLRSSNMPGPRFDGDDKNCFYSEGESKGCHSESSVEVLLAKGEIEDGDVYDSCEDEDVCPTCLEEYTPENPKINTKCSHNYHLGCIYEWLERSKNCPICGKLMEFDEATWF